MATTGTDIVGGPPVHTTGGDLLHHGRATDIDLGPGATPHVSIEGLPGSCNSFRTILSFPFYFDFTTNFLPQPQGIF